MTHFWCFMTHVGDPDVYDTVLVVYDTFSLAQMFMIHVGGGGVAAKRLGGEISPPRHFGKSVPQNWPGLKLALAALMSPQFPNFLAPSRPMLQATASEWRS